MIEYEVLHLRQLPDGKEREYRWHDSNGSVLGEHDDLHRHLNARGKEGWRLAAYASDGHFGNTMVLVRGDLPAGSPAGPAEPEGPLQDTVAQLATQVQALVTASRPRIVALPVPSMASVELQASLQQLQSAIAALPERWTETQAALPALLQRVADQMCRAVAQAAEQPSQRELVPQLSALLLQMAEQNRQIKDLVELLQTQAAPPPSVTEAAARPQWWNWRSRRIAAQ